MKRADRSHEQRPAGDAPLLELKQRLQALRAGAGAHRRQSRACAPGEVTALARRQRRRQVGADQDASPGIHAPDGGEICGRARRCGSAPRATPRALGIETVYQDLALCNNLDIVQNMFLGREQTARAAGRGGDGDRRGRDAREPGRHHRALDPPARRVALGRPAPVGRDRQGRALEREARDHGRADRRARRRPDGDGARTGAAAGRSRASPC